MSHARAATRAAGAWLTFGAVVWVVGLASHPPMPPGEEAFMALIAVTGTRWVAAHWAAAIALAAFTIASLVVLTARSRLTASGWGVTAWAVLPVAALWVMTTAIAEATVIAQSAAQGDTATFAAWHAFAEGKAMAFMALALTIALIAGLEARAAEAVTPRWAAWTGAGAGVTGFTGWVLGPVLGIQIGGLLFVVSGVVMGLWILWFGIGLVRAAGPTGATASHTDTGSKPWTTR